MLGDVAQPQLVRCLGGEVPLDQIVVDRRPDLGALATGLLLAERAPPAVVRADPPRRPARHRNARVAGFVEEEPVAELRVVVVGVEQGVGAVSLLELGVSERRGQPAVVGAGGRA
jgi:hypothetical protein